MLCMCSLIYFTFPYTVLSSVLFCLSYLKYIRGVLIISNISNLVSCSLDEWSWFTVQDTQKPWNMACTSQSAEGYIRSARRHLVGGLKNLSVILENLYQQGVLCDEEVSKIQAEKDDYDKTRKIVDSVTNKGEKACYEFLKIIDMTRKRTLKRPPVHPGTKTFDLHYWISCFPFKDDTEMNANYLQGILKQRSRLNICYISFSLLSLMYWFYNMCFNMLV